MSDSSRLEEEDDASAMDGADGSTAMPSSRDAAERVSARSEEQETGEAGNTTTAYVPALKRTIAPPDTSSSSTRNIRSSPRKKVQRHESP